MGRLELNEIDERNISEEISPRRASNEEPYLVTNVFSRDIPVYTFFMLTLKNRLLALWFSTTSIISYAIFKTFCSNSVYHVQDFTESYWSLTDIFYS